MTKFHISPKTAAPAKCSATQNCPFGSESEHFGSIKEAEAAVEQRLAEENGGSFGGAGAGLSDADKDTVEGYVLHGVAGMNHKGQGLVPSEREFNGFSVDAVEVSGSGDITVKLDPTPPPLYRGDLLVDMDISADDSGFIELSGEDIQAQAQMLADDYNAEYTNVHVETDYFEGSNTEGAVREHVKDIQDELDGSVALSGRVGVVPSDAVVRAATADDIRDKWESEQEDDDLV